RDALHLARSERSLAEPRPSAQAERRSPPDDGGPEHAEPEAAVPVILTPEIADSEPTPRPSSPGDVREERQTGEALPGAAPPARGQPSIVLEAEPRRETVRAPSRATTRDFPDVEISGDEWRYERVEAAADVRRRPAAEAAPSRGSTDDETLGP